MWLWRLGPKKDWWLSPRWLTLGDTTYTVHHGTSQVSFLEQLMWEETEVFSQKPVNEPEARTPSADGAFL